MASEMTRETAPGLGGVIALYAELTQTGAGSTDWVIFPYGCKMSIILNAVGTGVVEVTDAKYADVIADTVPTGSIVEWDNGTITAGKAQSIIEVCSAFRITSTSGDLAAYAYATRIQGNA